MDLIRPEQLAGDVTAGTGIAMINGLTDWAVVIANILVIVGRILLEWIILKNRKRKRRQ